MQKQSIQSGDLLLKSSPVGEFCGTGAVNFTVEDLVAIVGCDPATARRWLAGTQRIGPVALRLLNLHAHGRVLPADDDWRHWRFYGERLTWAKNWSFNGEELRRLFYDMQTLPRLQTQLEQAREYIAYLEALIPRAAVVPLENPRPGSAPVYTANPMFGQRADDSTPERLLALRQAGQL